MGNLNQYDLGRCCSRELFLVGAHQEPEVRQLAVMEWRLQFKSCQYQISPQKAIFLAGCERSKSGVRLFEYRVTVRRCVV